MKVTLSIQKKLLQTTRICSVIELVPYLDAWRELANGAPMRSPEWLLSWWEIYAAPDDELCVLLFSGPDEALVGLAPLYLQGVGDSATLRLLGSGDVSTNHTTWLSVATWETRVGIEVARFLLEFKAVWKRLLFDSVDADDAAIHATINYLAKNGCLQHQRQIASCWSIALPASWDDYLGMLSKSHRKRCRKLQKKFFDTGIIQVRQAESEADLGAGFEILLKLHAARWGSPQKPLGVFEDQKFLKFHQIVSKKLLAGEKLRLAWLLSDEKPIAVEYQFVDAKAVYAYQAGVDLSMDDNAPGALSIMAAIQFAIAQGCETFDLLRGDEPYKAGWRATPVACHDLRVWPDSSRGRVEWALWSGYTLAVRQLKPLISPRLINFGLKFFQKLRVICREERR